MVAVFASRRGQAQQFPEGIQENWNMLFDAPFQFDRDCRTPQKSLRAAQAAMTAFYMLLLS